MLCFSLYLVFPAVTLFKDWTELEKTFLLHSPVLFNIISPLESLPEAPLTSTFSV